MYSCDQYDNPVKQEKADAPEFAEGSSPENDKASFQVATGAGSETRACSQRGSSGDPNVSFVKKGLEAPSGR